MAIKYVNSIGKSGFYPTKLFYFIPRADPVFYYFGDKDKDHLEVSFELN